MDAGTDKASDLCLVAIRAIRDFDIRATSSPAAAAALAHADDPADPNDPDQPDDNDDEEKDDDDEDDDLVDVALPAATAQSILWKIPVFLWAVATDKIGGCDASIADSLPVERWCATVRRQCFGIPSATTPAHTPGQASTHVTPDSSTLETRFGTVLGSLERHFQLADERAAKEKAEKDSKAFLKLEPFTRTMILFVSEPTYDDTGNMETRHQPTDSYAQLLQLGNVAQAKLHLDHVIQTVHKCPASLPLATVNAILHGRFTWSDDTSPEAFSVFACFPPEPSAVNTQHADDFLAMQLKSAEGHGLSDSDVSRSTKVILKVPRTEHQLAEFIGAFALLLSILFGPQATIHLAIQGWLTHIREHQLVYAQLIRTDPAFGSKVLALIDRGVQLYFRACLDPLRQAGAERFLIFDQYQQQIIMNTFAFTILPTAIAQLLHRPTPTYSPSAHSFSQPRHASTTGTTIFNTDRLPSFQLPPAQVRILQNAVSTAPQWSYPHSPCHPCPRYHCGGECSNDCPRADTHRPPRDEEIGPFLQWIHSRTRWGSPTSNPPARPGGRSQQRQPPQTQTNTRNPQQAKRTRNSSPRPDSTKRAVHFAENKKDGNGNPDFP
jgi:hypothetical protein